jgi:hypothetical protein
VEELKLLTDVLAAMTESERKQALRTIDGPPRREKPEKPQDYIPLPTARRAATSMRTTTRSVRAASPGHGPDRDQAN